MTLPEAEAILNQLALLQLEVGALARKVEEALCRPDPSRYKVFGCPTDYSTKEEK